MLVIEGADKLGKTTLAHSICKRLREMNFVPRYAHMSRPPDDFDFLRDYLGMVDLFTIQDRFYFGEWAYGTNRVGIGTQRFQALQWYTLVHGGLVILALADDDFLIHMWNTDQREEMFSCNKVLEANKRFKMLRDLGYVHIDYIIYHEKGKKFPGISTRHLNQIVEDYIERQRLAKTILGVHGTISSPVSV
ncbi:hypothetical protein C4588_01010 [Candidatus Parcubacteria bacterium]|nr:MAG: hypothetical protein C4588_01010 [Candidatus Parcubacteria bacterium]